MPNVLYPMFHLLCSMFLLQGQRTMTLFLCFKTYFSYLKSHVLYTILHFLVPNPMLQVLCHICYFPSLIRHVSSPKCYILCPKLQIPSSKSHIPCLMFIFYLQCPMFHFSFNLFNVYCILSNVP